MKLLQDIDRRISQDKEEGDIAYFSSLMLKLEYLTKIVTTGIVSCIKFETDRHRYSLEHTLVRANSLGVWVEELNTALVGSPAQFLDKRARYLTRNLTKVVGLEDMRYQAVLKITEAAKQFDLQNNMPVRVALRRFFEIGVQLRNRTTGHGAATAYQCGEACPILEEALTLVVQNIELFNLPWVHLHRSLSGKYRVSPLLNDSSRFDYLKSLHDKNFPNGVYFSLDDSGNATQPIRVPFIFYDLRTLDISILNGKLKDNKFQTLSYVTNRINYEDGKEWTSPPRTLPKSETEGESTLEPLGNTFANVPTLSTIYVERTAPERQIIDELQNSDRHPILSLRGSGGIGKTTLAIAAIHNISEIEDPPYETILWISARDIDLLDSGPKPVSRRVFTQSDISKVVTELLQPEERNSKSFNQDKYFQKCLEEGAAGVTLFVIDNFETLEHPSDVVNWIDTYIRPPNKVLITTRFRSFRGDYPIEIGGMSDEESDKLIEGHAGRLGILDLLTAKYKRELIRESNGHPYVIKILLGEAARERKAVKPKRVVATNENLLDALFSRTFTALSPPAQRIFLLLCSWRVTVPEVALEAVVLRPQSAKIDVQDALEELSNYSLIDTTLSEKDQATFVEVPLAASLFGQRELEVSPFKVAVEEDRKILMEFRAGKKSDVNWGVLPRIEHLIEKVQSRVEQNKAELEKYVPILEYLASRFPEVYLKLMDLILEYRVDGSIDSAKIYLRKYLQHHEMPNRKDVWLKLASLCENSSDVNGEVHAYCEAALLSANNQDELGEIANCLNIRIKNLKEYGNEDIWSGEIQQLIDRVIEVMENKKKYLSATNCSRLAWLHLNIGNREQALDLARIGNQRNSHNVYCQRLLESLESWT